MKPTRTCDWPPRLDVVLPPVLRGQPRRQRAARRVRPLHPALRSVAEARWAGRDARARRFEKPVNARVYPA